jgi:hypothetical protein
VIWWFVLILIVAFVPQIALWLPSVVL